jgi:hypothetical protein
MKVWILTRTESSIAEVLAVWAHRPIGIELAEWVPPEVIDALLLLQAISDGDYLFDLVVAEIIN